MTSNLRTKKPVFSDLGWDQQKLIVLAMLAIAMLSSQDLRDTGVDPRKGTAGVVRLRRWEVLARITVSQPRSAGKP